MADEQKGTDWKSFWMGAATFFTVALSTWNSQCNHNDTVKKFDAVAAGQAEVKQEVADKAEKLKAAIPAETVQKLKDN